MNDDILLVRAYSQTHALSLSLSEEKNTNTQSSNDKLQNLSATVTPAKKYTLGKAVPSLMYQKGSISKAISETICL